MAHKTKSTQDHCTSLSIDWPYQRYKIVTFNHLCVIRIQGVVSCVDAIAVATAVLVAAVTHFRDLHNIE